MILQAVLTGCLQDSLPQDASQQGEPIEQMTIFASLTSESLLPSEEDGDETSTRVSISDEGSSRWQDGDQIALHQANGFCAFQLSDASTGAFTGPKGTYDGLAVSPWEISPRMDGNRLLFTFPGNYSYSPEKSYVPMIAWGESSFYRFYPCSGLVKFSISSVPATTRAMRFATSHKIQGEMMLGTPVPGTSAVQQSHPANDCEKEVIISISGGSVSTDMNFYIPLPVTAGEQTYESMSLSLLDGEGRLLSSMVSPHPRSVARKQMLRFKTIPASMPEKLYLLGGCFETAWNFDNGLTLQRGADGKYRGYGIDFINTQGFKLYLSNLFTAEWFGADASGQLINGPALKRNQNASADTQITPPFTGAADLTVDFANNTITIAPHSDIVYPTALSILGDAVGGWDTSKRIRFAHQGNGIYRVAGVNMDFGSSGELGFKVFPLDNDSWYPQYAQATDGSSEPNVDFGKVHYVESSGGDESLFYPGRHGYTSGTYTITLDVVALRLTLSTGGGGGGGDEGPVDGAILLENLASLRSRGTMFGMQIPTEYGLYEGAKWWDDGSISRSDVKTLCGSHPAVCGWDISGIELDNYVNIDGENFNTIRTHIQAAFGRGAVNTISWHCANPVTGGNSWDNTPAAYAVIPGGYLHEKFKGWLDRVAAFLKSLTTASGEQIPLIFRPWHEHTGNGFWWGKGSASQQDYIALWQFTISYLKETKGVQNLLTAYSPDAIHFIWDSSWNYRNIYLEYWPGDSFVDILGLDAYDGDGRKFSEVVPTLCSTIAAIAAEKGKIAALTETGLENNSWNATWWTQKLYPAIHGKGLTYALVWRNGEIPPRGHYFGPWKGCVSENDFVTFANNDDILFERDLPSMYR